MYDTGSLAAFTILSFLLAVLLIMKRDTLPPHVKRPLALVTVVLVSCSFFLIVFSFLRAGG